MSRRLAVVIAATIISSLGLAQCPHPELAVGEYLVAGIGTTYFGNFRTDRGRGMIEFYDGVCMIGLSASWTVLAERVVLRGIDSEMGLELDIPAPTVVMESWIIRAERLRSQDSDLLLGGVRFEGLDLSGTSREAQLSLTGEGVVFREVSIAGPQYIAQGAVGRLAGDRLTLEGAILTTCVCEGDPFYQLLSEEIDFELGIEELVIRHGVIEAGPIRYPLGAELRVTADSLRELIPPIEISYVGPDPATGKPRTGLEVTLSRLGLTEGVDLSLGAKGLDRGLAAQGFGLLRAESDSAELEFGLDSGVPRFTFALSRQLTDDLAARFEVRNLEQKGRDYLHEALVGLDATLFEGPAAGLARAGLTVGGFAAISSQRPAGGSVSGARLGVELGGRIESRETAVGRFTLSGQAQATEYPGFGVRQFGLGLVSTWSLSREPFTLQARYLGVLTDSGSPFSTRLDRLVPRSRLTGSATIRSALGPDLEGRFRVTASYDLRDSGKGVDLTGVATVEGALGPDLEGRFGITASYDLLGNEEGLDRLDFDGRLDLAVRESVLYGAAWAKLAGLLVPGQDVVVGAAAGFQRNRLDIGLRAAYEFGPDPGWEEVGVRLALPFSGGELTVTPSLTLNFVPLIRGGEGAFLTSHGVGVEWASCCGTLILGYQMEKGRLTALVDLRL